MKMSSIFYLLKSVAFFIIGLAPIAAFYHYKLVLRVEMPWFVVPSAVVIWGTLFGAPSIAAPDRRGDITAGVEELGSVFVVFGSWFVAFVMVVAHFI